MSELSMSRTVRLSTNELWRPLRLFAALGMALLLNACAVQQSYSSGPGVQQEPARTSPTHSPVRRPAIQAQPTRSPTRQTTSRTHPRYAPPPHVSAYWDSRLGVYVVEGQPLYYRERLYYRWSSGWYSASRPDGPWEPVAEPSVPRGLRTQHP